MQWLLKITLLPLLSILVEPVLTANIVRRLPEKSSSDTLAFIRSELNKAITSSGSDILYSGSTSLDKSFIDQKLFEYNAEAAVGKSDKTEASAGITITCHQCYIKGKFGAKLIAQGSFNLSGAVQSAEDTVQDTIHNLTTYATDILGEIDTTDLSAFEIPSPQISFNIKPPTLPECQLQSTFQDFELYVALDTVLSAGLTYTLNLYSSAQLGVDVGDSLFFGVVFSMDLILSVDSEIEISNGFHIKLDEVAMEIDMFSESASHLDFGGGQFEFLPVTVQRAGAVLKAVLRMKLRAGFSIVTVDVGINALNASVGIESSVYANIAEFSTNVTTGVDDNNDDDCVLRVVQGYQFAIGAAAGASLALLEQTWGPTPETEIPIYYTSLASACASSGRPVTTALITVRAPDGVDLELETTTLTTKVTYQAVGCASPGLINCPASLETSTRHVTTTTLVTSVPSGSEATWPPAQSAAAKTVPFGKHALSMTASSGKPTSYVPPPPPSSTNSAGETSRPSTAAHGKTGGVSNKIIIGVSVGLGVPLLLAIIVGYLLFHKRRQGAFAKQNTSTPPDTHFDPSQLQEDEYVGKNNTATT